MFNEVEKFFRTRYTGWEGEVQFEGTGARLKRMIDEMCWSPEQIDKELDRCFKSVFKEAYSEMVTSGPTSVWTLCPHHLLPCQFQVYIGYIPKGQVLGLSKFSRVAVILGKRPIMQETYTRDVAESIWTKLQPLGVGVLVTGRHGCMEARGILQDADVSTAVLKGEFMDDPKVKEEFYRMVKQ